MDILHFKVGSPKLKGMVCVKFRLYEIQQEINQKICTKQTFCRTKHSLVQELPGTWCPLRYTQKAESVTNPHTNESSPDISVF